MGAMVEEESKKLCNDQCFFGAKTFGFNAGGGGCSRANMYSGGNSENSACHSWKLLLTMGGLQSV